MMAGDYLLVSPRSRESRRQSRLQRYRPTTSGSLGLAGVSDDAPNIEQAAAREVPILSGARRGIILPRDQVEAHDRQLGK